MTQYFGIQISYLYVYPMVNILKNEAEDGRVVLDTGQFCVVLVLWLTVWEVKKSKQKL